MRTIPQVLYVNVLTFSSVGAIVKDDSGMRRTVKGPGVFEIITDSRFCCRALIVEASPPRYKVRFHSGEELWVCEERPEFVPEKQLRLAI
jgi:hypothetical protein